jgi:hypothetical protein
MVDFCLVLDGIVEKEPAEQLFIVNVGVPSPQGDVEKPLQPWRVLSERSGQDCIGSRGPSLLGRTSAMGQQQPSKVMLSTSALPL